MSLPLHKLHRGTWDPSDMDFIDGDLQIKMHNKQTSRHEGYFRGKYGVCKFEE